MGGDVAAAVQDGVHLAPVAVAGQRRPPVPEVGPVAEDVAVVGGDREASPHLRDGGGPGPVAGQADLDPAALRPPAGGPREQLAGRRAAEPLGAVAATSTSRPSNRTSSGTASSHSLANSSPSSSGTSRRPAQRRRRGRAPVDGGEPPAGRHVGQRLQQLAAARADVDDVERVRPAEGVVDPARRARGRRRRTPASRSPTCGSAGRATRGRRSRRGRTAPAHGLAPGRSLVLTRTVSGTGDPAHRRWTPSARQARWSCTVRYPSRTGTADGPLLRVAAALLASGGRGRRRPCRCRPRRRARRAGHRVVAVQRCREASRDRAAALLPGVPVRPVDEVSLADLVLFAVPDDALVPLVEGLGSPGRSAPVSSCAPWRTARAGGLRGRLAKGALPLALHPVMTFTGTSSTWPGSPAARSP